MFQQIAGFTLLESVLTLSLASITTATALSHLGDWISISEKTSLHYNQRVASHAMQTHRMWAQAAGKESPTWNDVFQSTGIDTHISTDGSLILTSSQKSYCLAISPEGQPLKHC